MGSRRGVTASTVGGFLLQGLDYYPSGAPYFSVEGLICDVRAAV
jgi:uncharacterized membrane protein